MGLHDSALLCNVCLFERRLHNVQAIACISRVLSRDYINSLEGLKQTRAQIKEPAQVREQMLTNAAQFFRGLREQMAELRVEVHEKIKKSAALKEYDDLVVAN